MHQSIFSREWLHALSHEKRCPCSTRTGYYFFSLYLPLRSHERSTYGHMCGALLLLWVTCGYICTMVYGVHFLLLLGMGVEAY